MKLIKSHNDGWWYPTFESRKRKDNIKFFKKELVHKDEILTISVLVDANLVISIQASMIINLSTSS